MNAGVTFERVYQALKEQICGGRFAPGEHLEPASFTQALNASITPVRDALHRLAGEGLVETPRGDGFRVPQATEVGLRHLYRLNAGLLDLAVRTRPAGNAAWSASPVDAGDLVERVGQLFLAIASRSANPELVAMVARLNDRLRAVRETEAGLIDDVAGELASLADTFAGGEARPLRRALFAYHRRREKRVDELVARLLGTR